MKLWLDDERNAPEGWKRVYSASEAIDLIKNGGIKEISLDHDLGENKATGYLVATCIEGMAQAGLIPRIKWNVHSMNPVGRKKIEVCLKQADKYWNLFN